MAILIGQIYTPNLSVKTVDGKEKKKFTFSLATNKAFINEGEGPKLFTRCVTYSPGLADVLSKYFGQPEHKGRAILVNGHYDEYTYMPDPNNANHDQFFKEFTITQDILAQGNIQLAQGSATQITIMVPIEQTVRQFIVSGFEFVDSYQQPAKPATEAPAAQQLIKVPTPAGAPAQQEATTPVKEAVPANLPVDDAPPF